MSDAETSSLADVAHSVSGLPTPIQTSFLKVIGQMLGSVTAIPNAWLTRIVRSIDDTTSARSIVADAIARKVADEALEDVLTMRAAAEIYLPSTLRKARNRVQVSKCAAEHLSAAATDAIEAQSPDDDWVNSFMRFAEDASSERLQDLFGRILAGEIVRPGSFGLATLRAVSELDQASADDFSSAWAESVGRAVDFGSGWHQGGGFSRWKRLSEAGLMAQSEFAQYLPPFHPVRDGYALWSPMQADGVWVNVLFQQDSRAFWNHIEFTRIGREIGSLLAPPDYESNMRRAADRLPKQGLVKIELYLPGKPPEIIWQADH